MIKKILTKNRKSGATTKAITPITGVSFNLIDDISNMLEIPNKSPTGKEPIRAPIVRCLYIVPALNFFKFHINLFYYD